jgi:hypothetical protein
VKLFRLRNDVNKIIVYNYICCDESFFRGF